MWSINKNLKIIVPTLFILMMAVGDVSAAASVLISPDSQSFLSAGDSFSVNVNVDSAETNLNSFDIRVAYDTSALSVTGATYSGLMSGMVIEQYEDDGEILVAVVGNEPYTSYEGTILTIDFRVKDNAEDGTYSLGFNRAQLVNENNECLSGTATGSIIGVGIEVDDISTPSESLYFDSQVKSTSVSTSTSIISTEQVGYSYIFGSAPDDYKVLNRYGELQTEANWSQDVLVLATQVEEELAGEYLFWYGKVMSIGTNSDGYLVVVFYEPLMVEGSEIDEIYGIIDGKAKEMGVEDVPVEFGEGTISVISDDLQELMTRVQEIESEGIENFMDDQSSLYDPTVLSTVGKIPSIGNEKECWEWYFQDSYSISLGISEEMNNYLQGGVLLSTSLSPDGYFAVDINKEADMDMESLMDEVYAIIDREALNIGVSDVPVVFRLAAPDEDTLESTSEEETMELEYVENQAQETPGFNLAISLLSISMVCYVINRFKKHANKK